MVYNSTSDRTAGIEAAAGQRVGIYTHIGAEAFFFF